MKIDKIIGHLSDLLATGFKAAFVIKTSVLFLDLLSLSNTLSINCDLYLLGWALIGWGLGLAHYIMRWKPDGTKTAGGDSESVTAQQQT